MNEEKKYTQEEWEQINEEKKYTQAEWEQIKRKEHVKDTSKGVVRGIFKCYCYIVLISVVFAIFFLFTFFFTG